MARFFVVFFARFFAVLRFFGAFFFAFFFKNCPLLLRLRRVAMEKFPFRCGLGAPYLSALGARDPHGFFRGGIVLQDELPLAKFARILRSLLWWCLHGCRSSRWCIEIWVWALTRGLVRASARAFVEEKI